VETTYSSRCPKDKSPFSEFRWADFLRDRIERETIESDFDCALALAMSLAWSREAKALPGWLAGVVA
jgi:hypothetical protein